MNDGFLVVAIHVVKPKTRPVRAGSVKVNSGAVFLKESNDGIEVLPCDKTKLLHHEIIEIEMRVQHARIVLRIPGIMPTDYVSSAIVFFV
jgi:hypothetical protein